MDFRINECFLQLKPSYLFSEIGKRVRQYSADHPQKTVIRLGIGDVTRPLPKIVCDAMAAAVEEMSRQETFRGYPPEYGYGFLREAIARRYAGFGVGLSPEEIFVSDGAKSDVGNIVDILGDNTVCIPDPVYPVYLDSNLMSGRKVRFVEGNESNGFLPLPDRIEEKGTVCYLCSPNNPTGAVYDRDQLTEWVRYALDTGSLLIYDSAYEAFIIGDEPHTIYEIPGAASCAIEICSFSKMAGFTGTRCGWTVVPNDLKSGGVSLNALWRRRQATKFNGVNYPVQRGAEAALSPDGQKACMENISYYRENARMLASLCDEKGISYTGGESSPYIWMKCPGGMDSWSFFDHLLNGIQVVGTPGAGFGKCGEGYFRLTAFGSQEATSAAVERMKQFL